MKWNKVWALLYRDMLVFRRAKWRLVQTFYFPITTVLIWGLFSVFMREFSFEAGLMVLALNIFWNFASIAQSSTNMQMMDDTWSGSLKEIFFTGIQEFEYLTGRIIFSTIISTLVLTILISMSYFLFGLSLVITNLGTIIVLAFATLISSIALSVFIAAMLISVGKDYGFLAWTVLQIFILLSAPFYSVDVFPPALQTVASVMPYTAIFENARNMIINGTISNSLLVQGILVSLVYLIISIPLYKLAFDRARRTGYLVRLS